MMSYVLKTLIVFICCMVVMCAGIVGDGAAQSGPVLQWSLTSPINGGNIYYGNVIDDHYYVGQNEAGILEYSESGYVNSLAMSGTSKAVVRMGDWIYFGYSSPAMGNNNLIKLDANDWSIPSTFATFSGGGPLESLTTDGEFIFSNDYSGRWSTPTGNYGPVHKYSLTTGQDDLNWPISIPGSSRIRGLSYYAATDHVYVVDGPTFDIWELNASGTSVPTTPLIHISHSGGTLYQAVRHSNRIYAVADNGLMYVYKLSGTTWSSEPIYTYDLGHGALYGIGINSEGNGIWVSSTGQQVHYYKLGHTASGQITLGSVVAGFDPTGTAVTIDITDVDTQSKRTVSTTLDGSGWFSVPDVLPGDKYTVGIKPSHWLKYVVKDIPGHNYEIPMPDQDQALGMVFKPNTNDPYVFINGDIDGSNKVDFSDYVKLQSQYKKLPAGSADLNGDKKVDFSDYVILQSSYKKSGDL